MPEKSKRVNTHSSRTGTNGKAIKATHQEHNFTAEHVNPELTPNNKVLLFQKVELDPDYKTKFEQDRYEQAVYKQFFTPCLDSRNTKAEQGRHKERVQTMQQFRQNKKACPEEVLFTIGNVNNPTDPETLWAIYLEYAEWHQQTFPNVMLLNAYEHVDEPNAAPHVQERRVWTAHEGDMLIISQSKALEEMGIERPFPDEPVSRTNNAKVTYSKMCREKQIEIARAHGLDIEDKPKEPSENGKTMLQLKMQTMQADNEKLKSEKAELQGQVLTLSQSVSDLTEQQQQAKEKLLQAVNAPKRPADPKPYGTWEFYDCKLTKGRFESDKAFDKRKHKAYEEYAAPIRQKQADWDSQWGLVEIAQKVLDKQKALDQQEKSLTAREIQLADGQQQLAKDKTEFESKVEQAVRVRTAEQDNRIEGLQAQLAEVTAERDELREELYPKADYDYNLGR